MTPEGINMLIDKTLHGAVFSTEAVQRVWMDLGGLNNIESEEGETVAPLLQQQSIDGKKTGVVGGQWGQP